MLKEFQTAQNADERNTALRSLGRAKDARLIERTLKMPLSSEVKDQDIYLPIGALRTHEAGIHALWAWMQGNWATLEKRLPPGLGMLGNVVQICTSSFTKQSQIDQVNAFFKERSTKGFDQGLAQSLDSIKAKASWLQRDTTDVDRWLAGNGYLSKTSEAELKL